MTETQRNIGSELCERLSRIGDHLTLTDAEREAIDWFASYGYSGDGVPGRHAATLRGLLERTSPAQDAMTPAADAMPKRDRT